MAFLICPGITLFLGQFLSFRLILMELVPCLYVLRLASKRAEKGFPFQNLFAEA